MPDNTMQRLVDEYTRLYFGAQRTVIAEFSGNLERDFRALLERVNDAREEAELPPLPNPDLWTEDDFKSTEGAQ